jgi:dihydroflavonol-4-reductase
VRNVLVTGGTGFIGSNLAVALLKEGCAVRILRRPNSDLRAIDNAPVEHCIGDIRDPGALKKALRGCDTVFHTAAKVSYWRREREEMYGINIQGTRNVVNACLELGVEKLIHTSSVAAIGFSEAGGVARETNRFNWDRYDVGYRISKHRAEEEVRKGVHRGLRAVMVNPSVVIGPRDIHFHGGQLVRDIYRKRLFYYISGGINIVYVDDVVRGHLLAAQYGRIGERYILCGENLTHREIIETIADVVGGIPPLFKVPPWMVRLIAVTAEGISTVLNVKPWVTKELLSGASLHSYFGSEKAQRELGYQVTPFRKAVQRAFNWYKEMGLI